MACARPDLAPTDCTILVIFLVARSVKKKTRDYERRWCQWMSRRAHSFCVYVFFWAISTAKTTEDENEVDIDANRQTYPSLNSLEDIIPTMMAIGVARRIEQIGPDSDLSVYCLPPALMKLFYCYRCKYGHSGGQGIMTACLDS